MLVFLRDLPQEGRSCRCVFDGRWLRVHDERDAVWVRQTVFFSLRSSATSRGDLAAESGALEQTSTTHGKYAVAVLDTSSSPSPSPLSCCPWPHRGRGGCHSSLHKVHPCERKHESDFDSLSLHQDAADMFVGRPGVSVSAQWLGSSRDATQASKGAAVSGIGRCPLTV